MPGIETRRVPPEETATFLFTPAEWSAPPWEMAPEAAVARQDELVESAMRARGAVWSVRTGQGDGMVGRSGQLGRCSRRWHRRSGRVSW
jgi:hypothetical protein